MPKKILLADDSLTIQKVVELTFSDSEYDLVCVSNGQRALERVQEVRPDLILADVVMPEKNGYEVCEAIKGDPATARIPVVLLTGTFEPFDRDRAERIGADAIVSKPFDSQQLLRQVEALLDRAPAEAPGGTTVAIPIPPLAASVPPNEEKPDPLDVGFSSDEFTGEVPIVTSGEPPPDLFEEEYAGADVEAAIAAFERSRPRGTDESVPSGEAGPEEPPHAAVVELQASREALAQWIRDEPETAPTEPEAAPASPFWSPREPERVDALDFVGEETGGRRRTESAPLPADEAPTMEIRPDLSALAAPPEGGATPEGGDGPAEPPRSPESEAAAPQMEALFDIPPVPEEPAPSEPAEELAAAKPEVPREIEELAQTSSIPELTQMLSSVSRTGELTDAEIDRIATRIVERLSDRVVREIAWEVIPDVAELVIKRRIKELESGVE
jgi:CheY-like chemotaxis protein